MILIMFQNICNPNRLSKFSKLLGQEFTQFGNNETSLWLLPRSVVGAVRISMSGFGRRFLPKPDGIFQKKPSVSLVVCGRGYQIVTDALTRFGLQPIVLPLGGSPPVLPQLNHQWIFQGGGRGGLHCVVEYKSGCYSLPWTTAAAHLESYMLCGEILIQFGLGLFVKRAF